MLTDGVRFLYPDDKMKDGDAMFAFFKDPGAIKVEVLVPELTVLDSPWEVNFQPQVGGVDWMHKLQELQVQTGQYSDTVVNKGKLVRYVNSRGEAIPGMEFAGAGVKPLSSDITSYESIWGLKAAVELEGNKEHLFMFGKNYNEFSRVTKQLEPWMDDDTATDLGMTMHLTGSLLFKLYKSLFFSVTLDYFLFRGKVAATDELGSSFLVSTGITINRLFKF